MKTLLKYLLVLTCASCDLFDLKEPTPKTELEKLPPITQTGENTFGYLVNGKAFVVNSAMNITAIYQGGVLQLGGGIENNNTDIDIVIYLEDPLSIGIPYDLTNSPSHISRYKDFNILDICEYEFEDTYQGSLTFSKIDRINYIVSGTFEFSTVTTTCDTVRITNGRFDVQYIP